MRRRPDTPHLSVRPPPPGKTISFKRRRFHSKLGVVDLVMGHGACKKSRGLTVLYCMTELSHRPKNPSIHFYCHKNRQNPMKQFQVFRWLRNKVDESCARRAQLGSAKIMMARENIIYVVKKVAKKGGDTIRLLFPNSCPMLGECALT